MRDQDRVFEIGDILEATNSKDQRVMVKIISPTNIMVLDGSFGFFGIGEVAHLTNALKGWGTGWELNEVHKIQRLMEKYGVDS